MAKIPSNIVRGLAGALLWTSLAWADAPAEVPQLIKQLSSDKHAVREKAQWDLVKAGSPTVGPLITAAQNKDPELAWRAQETLQLVCRSVDNKSEGAVKAELTRRSRGANKMEVALVQKTLNRWPGFRHDYAAGQLEQLGAEIVDYPIEAQMQMQSAPVMPMMMPGGGGMFFRGGGFGGGFMPMGMGMKFMLKDIVVAEPVEEEADGVAEAPAPELERAPKRRFFGEVIEILGRVARPRIEAMEEAIPAEGIEVEDLAEAAADFDGPIEVLSAPPAGGAERPSEEAIEARELQQGMMRLGRRWNGTDKDLAAYLAQLQNIHTVILREANISDATLVQLAKLRSMTQLRIINTKLSAAGLMKLRQLRPEVNIVAQGITTAIGVSGSDHAQGVLVKAVTPESGARRAGVDEEDVIAKVDGLRVRNVNDIGLSLFDKKPGQKVKVDVVRGGKARSFTVVLRSREEIAADAPAAGPAQVQHSVYQSFDFAPPPPAARMILDRFDAALPALGIDF